MPKIQKTFWVIYRALKISGKYLFSMQKKILKMGKKKSYFWMRRRRQLKLPWGKLCLIFFPNQFHRWILNEVFRKVPLFLSSFISCAMENCRKSLPRASKVKIIVPPREQEKVFLLLPKNQINWSVKPDQRICSIFSDLWERKTGAKRFDLLRETKKQENCTNYDQKA